MGSRESMNMGSRNSSTIISELRSVIASLGQTADSAYQKVVSSAKSMYGASAQGQQVSNNLVAPNPNFSSAPAITPLVQTGNGLVSAGPSGESNNSIARGPANSLSGYVSQHGGGTLYSPESGGGGGGFGRGGGGASGTAGDPNSTSRIAGLLGTAGKAVGTVFGAYNVVADMMPSTSDILEGQLLQKRASYFLGTSPGSVTANQNEIAKLAMLSGDNPQMDVLRAQVAAQSYGLGSSSTLLESAANVSNLMPGIGVEGAVRATGSMQQGYNVNMLRGIGIQLRGPDGSLKGPDAVITDVWAKICRDYGQAYGSGKTPSLREIQISLQPGNALDSMLNQYFGNDPMLKQLVANGLIFKAKATTAGTSDVITKGNLEGQGATTDAMMAFTETAAAGQAMITDKDIVSGASSGFKLGNDYLQNYYKSTINLLGYGTMLLKSAIDTMLTAFNGNLFSLIGSTVPSTMNALGSGLGALLPGTSDQGTAGKLGSLLGEVFGNPLNLLTVLPGMASGGEVSSNSPYIVGEKGPELFVPSSNGTIVSNDKLTSGTYTYNFTINAASGSTKDLVTEIKSVLVQLETNRKVSES